MAAYNINCPHCSGTLEVQEEWAGMETTCPLCRNAFVISPRKKPSVPVTPVAFPRRNAAPKSSSAQTAGSSGKVRIVPLAEKGNFALYGDYEAVWPLVRQVMVECGARIREENMANGKIVGNCKYGINAFGMTVTATLYSNGDSIGLEFRASFTDALDTFGACSKKVRQLGERLMALSGNAAAPVSSGTGPIAPPSYDQRAGASSAGKAKTSMILGLVGLIFCGPLFGILAIVFASIAFSGMAETGNEEGRGYAVAGMILGLADIVFGILIGIVMFAD